MLKPKCPCDGGNGFRFIGHDGTEVFFGGTNSSGQRRESVDVMVE
jgi:hypothetical protein